MSGMDNLAPSQQFDFYSAGLASGVTDIYSPFLGPSPRVPDGNVYDKRNTAKFNLPEDKMGKNLYLRDTMEDFMLTAQWTFWTERIMPWYRTDQIHIQWSEWQNNPAYMGVTPHQTTSRVTTQRRTIRKASIIRRGIAAEFEEGFIKTPTGRASFWASLKQMARSVQETANVEVLRALMYCHRFQQKYTLDYGVVAKDDLDAWLERRAERFMIVQKDAKGMEIINNHIDREQEMWGGKSNVWILGREVMDYCDIIPPERTWYFLAGQQGVDRLNGARQGPPAAGNTMGNIESLQPLRMVKDTPVFIAKSYAVEGIGKAELLSRITEIGIYNLMVDRTRDYSNYRTEGRAIRVYNNDRDNWSEIALVDAIKNCAIWNAEGDLHDPFKGPNSGDFGQDGDYDFLSKRVGGKRTNIRYVGEMNPEFLDTSHVLNVAQTVVQAAGYNDKAQIQAVINALTIGTGGGGTDNANDAAKRLASRIQSLLGGAKNPLFAGTNAGDLASRIHNLKGLRLAVKRTPATKEGRAGARTRPVEVTPQDPGTKGLYQAEGVNATIQTFFEDVLSAVVPPSKREQYQAIASRVQDPWEQRSKEVKAMIVECNKADASSTGPLKTAADIDKWHASCERELVRDLKKLGVSVGGAPAGVGAAATGEVFASVGKGDQTAYFHVDSELPDGYAWAAPATVGHDVFSSILKDISNLNAAPASQSSQLAARRFAGIGASYAPGARTDGAAEDELRQARRDLEGPRPGGHETLIAQANAVANASAPDYLRFVALLVLTTPINRDVFINMARSHVAVPMGFLLFRSHCTYKTRFGIKCAVNGETGYTIFGNSNMMVAHEAARMVGMMHYTAYLSAVVMYPKNVFVVEDLFCERYLGGMGVTFWSPARYVQSQGNRRAASIICAPLPPSCKELEEKIDMRGRWYTEMELQLVTQDRFDRPLYPGAARMNSLFKWYDSVRKDRGANRGKVAPNYVCWQGMEWYYNTKSGQWDDFTVESGCMGPKVYPGCGKVRNGQMKHLKDPQYQGGGGERYI